MWDNTRRTRSVDKHSRRARNDWENWREGGRNSGYNTSLGGHYSSDCIGLMTVGGCR